MKDYYKLSVDETLNELNADSAGLSSERAAERLAQYGPNKLKEAEKPGFWKRFLTQLKDPMLIILLAAAGVSALTGAIAGESEWAETIIILAVVLLNAVLGVLQESKAESAIEALQTMTAATCKVLRDGKMAVLHSDELVPGDVVLLEAGDAVPADGRIIESASLKIEEAALTGESVPVNKMLDVLGAAQKQADVPLGDRKNMCYMGSTVVYGRGKAVITATGMSTEMGKIAGVLSNTKDEQTPLQRKTGTLTQNKMTVVEHIGETLSVASAMALCSDAVLNDEDQAEGEPTECALVNFACSVGAKKRDLEKKSPRIDEAPFDSARKMMSTVHKSGEGFVQYTKGAPDALLSRCTHYFESGKILPMTDAKRQEILNSNKAMADRALRVLAVAKRDWAEKPENNAPEYLERDLVLLGLTGMIDPIRPEVKAAIAECRGAGIRAVMITGDHRDTAVAIMVQFSFHKNVREAEQTVKYLRTGCCLRRFAD